MRVIGPEGEQVGIVSREDALRMAEEAGVDLVEIAPQADPPVCRVMDYGKHLFEESKRKTSARKRQQQVQVKEMKFRPATGEGDYQVKLRKLVEFITEGDKAKVTLMFRGREMAHPEQGRIVLDRLAEDLRPFATVEQAPLMEGRNMHMTVAPIKGAFDDKPGAVEDDVEEKKEN